MVIEKRALWVIFRPEDPESTDAMREKFLASYEAFRDMTGLFSKVWWSDPDKGEWGAMYIFNSEEDLRSYLQSERWLKKIPEKYGYKPEVAAVLDLGPILYKQAMTEGEGSWLSEG
ncbi:YdhR family protein [Candidatus Methanocrinis natronophilus]|uniref:YdhR family protein n=1 Tax=Candidatus Methanocrinis natronophilus TaxID=3033396 RepID=A0ABT5X666_9EURY|nr:YdhR family protein [Candidatus Methanocrinis natronophilus]MDF0590191.1 YdhR family protein [Candidatus Methanocrinis natronophilus]